MVKEELTRPHINKDRENEYFFFSSLTNYSKFVSRVKGEYVNRVLTNYFRGPEARKVIEFILENMSWTIPTISYATGAPRQTVDQILRRLKPWVIQTKFKLQHPVKAPGNRPLVWMRHDADTMEAIDYARKAYYSTLLVSGPQEVEEPAIIYELSEKGQRLASTLIKYFMREDRLYLEPSAAKLKQDIGRDEPDMSMKERDAIVRHIMGKVRELREADS